MKNNNLIIKKDKIKELEKDKKIKHMAGNWIIKCKKQSDYKLVKRALSSQDIPSKTKIKDTEDGTKKIKAIVVSKKHVDFADTIYFSLGDENIDFTLYEKEKGRKKRKSKNISL